nr:hypothetical protein [Candidatus Sigynarchaeota archaeon]
SHDDYVACIGRTLGFYPSKRGITAFPQYLAMKNYKIEGNSPEERMIAHMQHYVPSSFYAVQRVSVWKNTMRLVSTRKDKFSCPYVPELQMELSTSFQGKSVVIEDLMWLRNKENPPINNSSHNLKIGIDIWFAEPRYKDEVDFFYNTTAAILAKIDNMKSTDAVRESVHQAIKIYFSSIKHPSFIQKLLSRVLPAGLKRALKGWKTIMEAVQDMQRSGVHVDTRQLQEIIEYMKNVPTLNT